MDQLPAEIVSAIFADLRKKDLKCLRLTCRGLSEVCESYLFKGLKYHISPGEQSLQDMEELSQNPRVLQYLDTVVCEANFLGHVGSFKGWKKVAIQTRLQRYVQENHVIPGEAEYFELQYEAEDEVEALAKKIRPDLFKVIVAMRAQIYQERCRRTQPLAQQRLLLLMAKVRPKKEYRIIANEDYGSIRDLENFASNTDVSKLPRWKRKDVKMQRRYRLSTSMVLTLQYMAGISADPTLSKKKLVIDNLPLDLIERCMVPEEVTFSLQPDYEQTWDKSLITQAWRWLSIGRDFELRFKAYHAWPYFRQWVGQNLRPPGHYAMTSYITSRRKFELAMESFGAALNDTTDTSGQLKIVLSFKHCGGFARIVMGDEDFFEDKINGSIRRHIGLFQYTQFDDVTLEDISLTLEEIRNLIHCQPKMKRLKLRNVFLRDSAPMVKVINLLHEVAGQFQYIELEGIISSPGDGGNWYILPKGEMRRRKFAKGNGYLADHDPEDGGLKARINNFIQYGGDCPLRLPDQDSAGQWWDLINDPTCWFHPMNLPHTWEYQLFLTERITWPFEPYTHQALWPDSYIHLT